MHNRSQYIKNIKNYISSEKEYSAKSLVQQAFQQQKDTLEAAKTGLNEQQLYDNYKSFWQYPEYNKMTPEAAAQIVEHLVLNDHRDAGGRLERFEKQLDYLSKVLEQRPDALSDEALETIDQFVRHNAHQLNQPVTDTEAIKKYVNNNGVQHMELRKLSFFHKPDSMPYEAGLFPEQEGTIEDAVVLYDINKAVEELGGKFYARAQVADQYDKEASFMTFPVKAGEPLRKAEMIKAAVPHGLAPAFKGIAEGMELRINKHDLDDQYRGYVSIDVLYDRDADVTALVDALNATVFDLETEARLKAEAQAYAQDHADLMKGLDEMVTTNPVKKKGFLGNLLAKATLLQVNIPPLQTVEQGQESAPEQSFE